jgi:hypothetical protein
LSRWRCDTAVSTDVLIVGQPRHAVDRTKRVVLRPYVVSARTLQAAVGSARAGGRHPGVIGIAARATDLDDAIRALHGGHLVEATPFHHQMDAGVRDLPPAGVTPA